jgi:hypothetical protein
MRCRIMAWAMTGSSMLREAWHGRHNRHGYQGVADWRKLQVLSVEEKRGATDVGERP